MSDKGTILGHTNPVIQHDADGIDYDNTASGLTAVDVQAAIDEVVSSAVSVHNSLGGLQGGASGEYYHFDATKYGYLNTITSDIQTQLGAKEPTLPLTTRGDMLYRNSSNVTDRLAVGASTYVLTSDGTDVAWAAPAGGGYDREEIVSSGGSSAVNAAITTINSAGGGYVTIDGVIDLDGDIVMKSNVTLRGLGRGTGLRNNTANNYEIQFVGTTPTWYNIALPVSAQSKIVCDTVAQAANFSAGDYIIVKDNAGTTAACWFNRVKTNGNATTGEVVTYGSVLNPSAEYYTASAQATPLTGAVGSACLKDIAILNTSSGTLTVSVQYAVNISIKNCVMSESVLELDHCGQIEIINVLFDVEDSTSHANHIIFNQWLGAIKIDACTFSSATTAIEWTGASNGIFNLQITNNTFNACATFLDLQPSTWSKCSVNLGKIIGNIIHSTQAGTYICISRARLYDVVVEGNVVEGSATDWYMSGGSGWHTACIFANNRIAGELDIVWAYRCMIANNNANTIQFLACYESTVSCNNSYSILIIGHGNLYSCRENNIIGNNVRTSFICLGTTTYPFMRNTIMGNTATDFYLYDYALDTTMTGNIIQSSCTMGNSSGDVLLRTIFSNNKVMGAVTFTEPDQDYCSIIGNTTDGTITDLTSGGGTGNVQEHNIEY